MVVGPNEGYQYVDLPFDSLDRIQSFWQIMPKNSDVHKCFLFKKCLKFGKFSSLKKQAKLLNLQDYELMTTVQSCKLNQRRKKCNTGVRAWPHWKFFFLLLFPNKPPTYLPMYSLWETKTASCQVVLSAFFWFPIRNTLEDSFFQEIKARTSLQCGQALMILISIFYTGLPCQCEFEVTRQPGECKIYRQKQNFLKIVHLILRI